MTFLTTAADPGRPAFSKGTEIESNIQSSWWMPRLPSSSPHRADLESVLDPGEDSVLVCDLGLTATLGAEQFSFLGRSREISVDGPIII